MLAKIDKSKIKTVILCGGLGTRMKEETEFKPKPLVEIGSKPIIWHIMKIYSHYGFNNFVLALGYKGNMIKEYFHNYEWMTNDFTVNLRSKKERVLHDSDSLEDWNVTLAETGYNTNTGGRIKKIEKYINEGIFMATYGDGLADINIDDILRFHLEKNKLVTLAGVHLISNFGILEVADGVAKSFKEKPKLDGTVNGGFFIFKKEFLDILRKDDILEERPLREAAERGELAVYAHNGFWKCCDTYKDSQMLNTLWESKKCPWKVWK